MAGIRKRLPRRVCPSCPPDVTGARAGKAPVRDVDERGRCLKCSAVLFTVTELRTKTKYLVDGRDAGARVTKTFTTREDAKLQAAKFVIAGDQASPVCVVDRQVRVAEYGDSFLEQVRHTRKPGTHRAYASLQRLYVIPALGHLKVREVQQGHLKALLIRAVESNHFGVARLLLAFSSVLFSAAVDDGLIQTNPAAGLGRKLNLKRKRTNEGGDDDEVHAMHEAELDRFLVAAQLHTPEMHTLFLLKARTGLRLGEVRGLQWPDLDLVRGKARIVRTYGRCYGKKKHTGNEPMPDPVGRPKSGKSRVVDLSRELRTALEHYRAIWQARALQLGWADKQKGKEWIFAADSGKPYDEERVRYRLRAALRFARLPGHWTPHTLRHTFAVIHLGKGTPITYVQAQLGHATIAQTVDTYGRWIPSATDTDYADRLDARRAAVELGEAVGGATNGTGGTQRQERQDAEGPANQAATSPSLLTFAHRGKSRS